LKPACGKLFSDFRLKTLKLRLDKPFSDFRRYFPTDLSYAALCQEGGLVPIVEPEVLIDGDHSRPVGK